MATYYEGGGPVSGGGGGGGLASFFDNAAARGNNHSDTAGASFLEQALQQSRVPSWQQDPFTADLCESLLPAAQTYGEFASTLKGVLLSLLKEDLGENVRRAILLTSRALERSESVFLRREQHLAWHLPFHLSRTVDETCKQLHNSNLGDVHLFPFVFAGPTVCVVNHITSSAFDMAVIVVNPTESRFLPFSTDKPPKMQVQSVLEIRNIPKKRITSEAFWAVELVAGQADDAVVATHVIPWLNSQPIAELVRNTRDPAFATGSKNDSGNLWKAFVHAFKYIARTAASATKSEIKAVRVLIKKFFLERALEDLGKVQHVDHSTRLVVRAALQNSSLCLARNAQCLPDALFHDTRRLIDNIAEKMKALPSTDEASTLPPPLLDMDSGWKKVQFPEQYGFMECMRRVEPVDHFAGTAVEQPRFVPVNFFNVPNAVKSFDDAVHVLEMALHVTNRAVNQIAIVRRAPFAVVAFLTRIFLEVLPVPLGPKDRKTRFCVWHPPTIRYGQQLQVQQRLWALCETYVWCSLVYRSVVKEFDAQRITVFGNMCAISDAVIRQMACDQPSMISRHLRGFRRKAAYGVNTGRFAEQTDSCIHFNPAINVARCAILDYHNQVCADIPPGNIMFQWEDGWNMCKATQSFFRQLATIEGLPVSQVNYFFQCEESGGAKVVPGRYYSEYRHYRDLYVVFKIFMGQRSKLPTCTQCLPTCCSTPPQVTVEARGSVLSVRVRWIHGERFAKASHLRFPSFAVASRFTTPFEASNEDDLLHIKSLPTFDDCLGQRDAELLLSYMTTPYLRIPLVLNFFATEDRVSCLSNRQIRDILESILFEPATFLPHSLEGQCPQQVPSENPALVATAQGVLLNEVQFNPRGLVEPLARMVELGREMDAGTVQNTQVVDLILFLVRVASRVDGYLSHWVTLYNEWKASPDGPKKKVVRGLHFDQPATVAEVVAARIELHKITVGVFVPMIESWVNELVDLLDVSQQQQQQQQQQQAAAAASAGGGGGMAGVPGGIPRGPIRTIDSVTRQCNNLYAHVLLLLRNLDRSELTSNTCSLILSSMVFISTRYNPGLFSQLDVSDVEVYDSVEKMRRPMAQWLNEASPKDVSYVMDSTVRVATSTGKRTEGHCFQWGLVAGQDCVGRFTRVDHLGASPSTASPVTVLSSSASAAAGADNNNKTPSFDSKRPLLEADIVEAFGDKARLHPDVVCLNEGEHDVEINLMTFSLTFKAAHLIAMPAPIAVNADLHAVFASSGKLKSTIPSMQSAVVQDAEHRMWVRLVGQEMDVVRWATADQRIPLPEQDMRFFPDDLSPQEDWILRLVEPVRQIYFQRGFMAPPIFLLLPRARTSQDQCVVTLVAVCSKTGAKLKEIVAFRDFETVHVYDVVSIGRRWYRKLLYTSNAYYCLRALQPATVDRFSTWKKWARHAAGDFEADAHTEPPDSCIIMRHPTHPTNVSKALETFIPSRLLHGLIPDVLLEQFEFWQDPDDNIRGYPRKASVDPNSSDDVGASSASSTHILWLHWRELNYAQMNSFHDKQIVYKVLRFANKKYAPKVSERAVLVSQKWETPDEEDDELERMRTNSTSEDMVAGSSSANNNSKKKKKSITTINNNNDDNNKTEKNAKKKPKKISESDAPIADAGADDSDTDDDDAADQQQKDDNDDDEEEDLGPSMGMFREASAVLNERSSSSHNKADKKKQKNKEVASIEDLDLLLINLMYSRQGTPLHSLAKLLGRIELLSHVLCWTTQIDYDFSNPEHASRPLTIDLIQLPRLKLTFAAKIDADGICRIFSLDHAHLFVSNLRPPMVTEQLIQGMPHSVLLSDASDNISILVPALQVVRPMIMQAPFSTDLVVNRANRDWYKKLDSRYYLYPVHVSLSFLFTPTLASALYLISLRFLHCEYADVFRLASTIGTDMALTDEEEQNFKLLAARDNRHEAIACRVKIGLLVSDSPIDLLWYLPVETAKMIRSYSSIPLECRLSVTEERRLLQVTAITMKKVAIVKEAAKNVDIDILMRFVPAMQRRRGAGGAASGGVAGAINAIYSGMSGSEVKTLKEMFANIATELRNQLSLRVSRDELWRTFSIWWNQRRTPLPDFYRCLLYNRESFLKAEAEAIARAERGEEGAGTPDAPAPTTAKMILPEREQDEGWQFYRDFDVLSCKLPSAQEMIKNDADRVMKLSGKIDYFYCGQACRKQGERGCRCRQCDEATCGADEGCPCLACEKWNKRNLLAARHLPAKISYAPQRILSFFDVNTWIEDVVGLYSSSKAWRRNQGGNVHPTVLATTKVRCASLRQGSSNFIRMYELLTGSSKCRIGSSDSARDIVPLLFPLCYEARRPESALGHMMHFLLNNPQVLPKLPKLNKFSKDDKPEEKVAKIYAAIFQHAAHDTRYPPAAPAKSLDDYARTVEAVVKPRPATRTDPIVPILATRLLPSLADTDLKKRQWTVTDLSLLEIAPPPTKEQIDAAMKAKEKAAAAAVEGMVSSSSSSSSPSSSTTAANSTTPTTTGTATALTKQEEAIIAAKKQRAAAAIPLPLDERRELSSVTDALRDDLRKQPLLSAIPDGLVIKKTRAELGEEQISAKMPFDLRHHDAARTSVAKSMIERLDQDLADFAGAENNARKPRIAALCPSAKAAEMLRAGGEPVHALKDKLEELVANLQRMRESDIRFTGVAFAAIERTVNAMPVSRSSSAGRAQAEAIMHLRRLADQEAKMNLSYIISSLSSECGDTHWRHLNPFLTPETIAAIHTLSTTALLRANRVGHANRAAEAARELINLLKKVQEHVASSSLTSSATTTTSSTNTAAAAVAAYDHTLMNALISLIDQKADSLAGILATERVYIAADWSFDPRFLLFEYTWSIVLRPRQVQMIGEIYGSIVQGQSICKQLIMGQGKSTVIGPLLGMMLADSKNLVTIVVPPALLDFTRSVLRATFSSVINKQIFAFISDRASDVDSEVLEKFVHARNSRGIVVTTPSSIKSVFLKMMEGMDRIEDAGRKPFPGQDKEVRDVSRLLDLWRNDGVLIMDEVDLLLHPLKSELNFPIGAKHEIDFAPLRWKLPIHLLDAVFYATTGHLSTGIKETPENRRILQDIASALQLGLATNCLQGTPHTTLLNLDFYEQKMRKPFAEWAMLFLKANHFSSGDLKDEDLVRYVTLRPSAKVDPLLNQRVEKLEPDHVKTLNLIYDWVVSFLPHVLAKIDRVSFGIMNSDDMQRARDEHPNMPKSRFVTAIPFIGKDLPSPSSEFAHPDVVIGLSILAYRYEGLRQIDYTDIMRQIFAAVEKEVGRFSQRRTTVMYNKWVAAAGGKIISSFSYSEAEKEKEKKKKREEEKQKKEQQNKRGANIKIESHRNTSVDNNTSTGSDLNANNNNTTVNNNNALVDDDDEEVGMQPSESIMAMVNSTMGGDDDDEGGGGGMKTTSVASMGGGEDSSDMMMMRSQSSYSYGGGEDGASTSGAGAVSSGQSQHQQQQQQQLGGRRKKIDILPLRLMKQANREESQKLFRIFKRCPEVIHWWLNNTVFPQYMRHQLTKLSASGQELGGDILFKRRIGFSGTPSDLMPVELGALSYERGTDGKLLHTLTSPLTMSVTRIERDWTVRSVLDFIANANPPYHALIDTGALITGMSNLQVAQYLLKNGLPSMEGVVFLDEHDRKMILVRSTGRVLKLAECGIPKVKRFAVYDQVHTTGMDIDHTPNAVAVQTLGKDMVFRDFSQGAYRMRGIGLGQRVDILVIPEVHDLIQRAVSSIRAAPAAKGGNASSSSSPASSPTDQRLQLLDISTWLLVNSIRSEHVQHNQLCLQTISNVWRKEAFRHLKKAEEAGEFMLSVSADGASGTSVAEVGGTDRNTKISEATVRALAVYREPVDYAVPIIVPQPRMFSEAVQALVDANAVFIVGDGAKKVVGGICDLTRREDEIDNPVIDVQMVQEQEEEREQEEEKQKEHEIEMEKFVDLAYSRDDEAAVPWSLSSLKDANLASQFYPLSDFRLHKRRPLQFPESILLSRNFFNPKWSGQRRIKNSIVALEWLPNADAVVERERPHLDYGCLDEQRQSAALEATLSTLRMLEGPFSPELVRDFGRVALNTAHAPTADELWVKLSRELQVMEERDVNRGAGADEATRMKHHRDIVTAATNLFLKVLQSNQLRREQTGRYSVLVTLAEAETLRRVIHIKKAMQQQPLVLPAVDALGHVVPGAPPNVQLALRMIPASNRVMDATHGFREGPMPFQRDRNYQSVRFFDGDLHYLDADLSLLLRAIHAAPQRHRQTYFLQTLSCRRRARQRWENSPVALAFNLQDAYSWLHQKTLGMCMRRALERKGLHLADAFVSINESQSGKLTADEIWGAFRFCGMTEVTASDVLDFVQVADTHHEGSIHYSDFLSILTGTSEIEDDDKSGGGSGGAGSTTDRARLPTVRAHGAKELTELHIERAQRRRADEAEANQQLASEERKIREEIEAETIKEELAIIQTSTNPKFDEVNKSLRYSLREARPPKLAQFFGTVDAALLEDLPDDTVKSGAAIEASSHPEITWAKHEAELKAKRAQAVAEQEAAAAAKRAEREAAAAVVVVAGGDGSTTTGSPTTAVEPTIPVVPPTSTSPTTIGAAANQDEQNQEQEEQEKEIVETGPESPFFGLVADGGMRLVARSIKLLNDNSAQLRNYGITLEFRVPFCKMVGKKKVKLRKFSEAFGATTPMTVFQFSTRVWMLCPSVSKAARAGEEADDETAMLANQLQTIFEASDSDQDKKDQAQGGGRFGDSDDDGASRSAAASAAAASAAAAQSTLLSGRPLGVAARSGRAHFLAKMKMLNFVFATTNPAKHNRLKRIKMSSSFEESRSCRRVNTVLGGDSYEWMKIAKPVEGWVVLQVNGIQMLLRERISINLTSEGTATVESSFPKDGGIADLPPTVFSTKKPEDSSDDDDNGGGAGGGMWSQWDQFLSFFSFRGVGGGGGDGDDEKDSDDDNKANAQVDLGDIGDLMSEIRRKKELKPGDKVKRNPAEWSHADQDGGEGTVGRVIKVDQGSVVVLFPNGNKVTCIWGTAGKFELIKVADGKGDGAGGDGGDKDDDKYFGREVQNDPKWSALCRDATVVGKAGSTPSRRCGVCSNFLQIANEQQGFMKCNACPGYQLCLKCFRTMEHAEHNFTDLCVLAEVLRETTIMPESTVRIRADVKVPTFGWGQAPRDGSAGVVSTVDDENGSCVVKFDEGVTWTAALSELELLDPRHEVLGTSWLGAFFMQQHPLERRRNLHRLTLLVDESLALPVVQAKFAVRERVKALVPGTSGQWLSGEIRAAMPGAKYVVAFDDGRVTQDVKEEHVEPFEFKVGQKVRLVRRTAQELKSKPYMCGKLPYGVSPGQAGEIVAINAYSAKLVRIQVKLRTGVSLTKLFFNESDIEPVQPTRWFFSRVDPASAPAPAPAPASVSTTAAAATATTEEHQVDASDGKKEQQEHQQSPGDRRASAFKTIGVEMDIPASNIVSLERSFACGKPTADLYFKSETFTARLDDMILVNSKTHAVAAVLRRDPPEPFVLQADRPDFFDSRWHVMSLLLTGGEPQLHVDGTRVTMNFNVVNANRSDADDIASSEEEEKDEEDEQRRRRKKDNSSGGDNNNNKSGGSDDDDDDSDDSDAEEKKETQGGAAAAAAADEKKEQKKEQRREQRRHAEAEAEEKMKKETEAAAAAAAVASAMPLRREKAKLLPLLQRSPASVMQIDIREPVTILPFLESAAAITARAKFGPTVPNRYVAGVEVCWGKESGTAEAALQKFKQIDAQHLWACKECEAHNSRLVDACKRCGRDRFLVDGKIQIRHKLRAVTHKSNEAKEVRQRLHAQLRQQCQKQLEQMEEASQASLNNLL